MQDVVLQTIISSRLRSKWADFNGFPSSVSKGFFGRFFQILTAIPDFVIAYSSAFGETFFAVHLPPLLKSSTSPPPHGSIIEGIVVDLQGNVVAVHIPRLFRCAHGRGDGDGQLIIPPSTEFVAANHDAKPVGILVIPIKIQIRHVEESMNVVYARFDAMAAFALKMTIYQFQFTERVVVIRLHNFVSQIPSSGGSLRKIVKEDLEVIPYQKGDRIGIPYFGGEGVTVEP